MENKGETKLGRMKRQLSFVNLRRKIVTTGKSDYYVVTGCLGGGANVADLTNEDEDHLLENCEPLSVVDINDKNWYVSSIQYVPKISCNFLLGE